MIGSLLRGAVILAAGALFAGTAMAQVNINIGHATAEGGPYDVQANAFKDAVERESKGAIKVRVFCCFKMGSEEEMFQKLQLGTLDATIIAHNNVGPYFPKIDVLVLPYVFESYAHAEKVVDGPIGEMIWGELAAKTGVHLLYVGQISLRSMYNTKRPVNSMADLAGLKFRVPKNPVMIDTYKAFGSEPTPLAWGETLTATQTGTVDGGDLPLVYIWTQKFSEIAKNLTITEHFTMLAPLLFSDKAMQKMSPEQQAIVRKAAKEGSLAGRNRSSEEEKEVVARMEAQGVKVTRPDKKPFMDAAKTVQANFIKERGPEMEKLLQAILAAAK
ncbi:MAG: TRAP transporter substrate-binding protein [Alphaproteobacteria bacterium]|nr:TRAP transporter substrate-binding protein [Alphaproteobacteria bacterium]